MIKQKSCVKRIDLVTNDGLYDQKAFYKVKIIFCSSSMNDCEFINYFSLAFAIYAPKYFSYAVQFQIKANNW